VIGVCLFSRSKAHRTAPTSSGFTINHIGGIMRRLPQSRTLSVFLALALRRISSISSEKNAFL
jgi:hypothetical protein